MSGVKFLYLSGEEVYPIPIPKKFVFKAIPELAKKSVLEINLIYETCNRKPWRLIDIGFDRILLDEIGQYTLTDQEAHNGLYNFLNFGYTTPEELSKREDPSPIPKAIVVPDAKEKEVLIKYIKKKYPLLWENSPEVLERSIKSRTIIHSELKDMVKKASVIKRKLKEEKFK